MDRPIPHYRLYAIRNDPTVECLGLLSIVQFGMDGIDMPS